MFCRYCRRSTKRGIFTLASNSLASVPVSTITIRGVNVNHADFEDFVFRHVDISDFKAELVTDRDLETLLVSVEVRRGVDQAVAAERLKVAVREHFELTPRIVVVETGTLAKQFEASVKTPRFVDRRH